MTPWDQARAIFDEEQPNRSWQAWVRLHQVPPRVFVNDAKGGVILFAEPCGNTWRVWFASGPLAKLHEYFPYPLPRVAWVRHKTKTLHLARWDRITRLINLNHGRI